MIGLGELESAVMGLGDRVSDAGVLLVLVVLLFVGVAGRMLRRRRTASREAVPGRCRRRLNYRGRVCRAHDRSEDAVTQSLVWFRRDLRVGDCRR